MQTKRRKKRLSSILYMVLIVAMALFTTGCNGGTNQGGASGRGVGANAQTEAILMGEGDTSFDFAVVDRDGNETRFEIHTNEEMVGAALQELGLIGGEEGEFGLFVKTVNGITADYDKDGVYWAFYVNGEYAPAGVSATAITEGEVYSFRVE